jgi:oligoendopeptidase F
MKTTLELEQRIIKITTTVHQHFPELAIFITEMPENNSETEVVNVKSLEAYYDSLKEVFKTYATTHELADDQKKIVESLFPGYPIYPPSEDIYSQGKEEKDLNPEDISKKKAPNEKEGSRNEKGFEDDMSGSDLDVPGSELDDDQEKLGSEDEENNYYSIGGDNHNDLEENRG